MIEYKTLILYKYRCFVFVKLEMTTKEIREAKDEVDNSKVFWDRISSLMPDYEVRRQWLKENGIKLDL